VKESSDRRVFIINVTMNEITSDELTDLLIDSILGRLTRQNRDRLTAWAEQTPARRQFYREVHDPVIASREMAIYCSIDPRKGYERWLRRRRKMKK
jgi:hypothetical protein